MSGKIEPGYADPKGVLTTGFDLNGVTAEGAAVPTDGTSGYAPGCVFFKRAGTAGAAHYINEGTATSCAFKALTSQSATGAALNVKGVAAGYKIARGQATTVAASDTIITGLATVVSAYANMDDDPVVGCSFASASIGDQAGTPAAGSILLKTWKPTTAGVAGNPDVIAATTFTKKVNWIAVGT